MSDFWHEADRGRVHEGVFGHVRTVQRDQSDIDRKNRDLARFYSNRSEIGIHGTRGEYRHAWGGVTENIIASVVDTATSLIGKSRPKVTVLTDGGEWSAQQTAKKIEKYIGGQFDALGVYDIMAKVFRDSCIFGTGCVHAYIKNGEVNVERVIPSEIVVNEDTVRSGEPLEMHRVRLVSKTVLKHKYKKYAYEIDTSGRGIYDERFTQADPDTALIVESWRLPVAGKGRYTLCVENCTLEDRDYSAKQFPFVFYRWSPPLTGFYGQGLAEYLLPYQIRLNELTDFIQRCQDLIAVPRVFVEAGSKLLKTQLNNEVGAITSFVGQPPIFHTPQAITAEIYNQLDRLKTGAFEMAGISKMAAQATRPEGIEAGVALRELSDNQSQRFSIQQARYERAHIDLAKLIIELVKPLGKTAPRAFLAKSFVETIPWPDVDFEKNRYVFSLQPSSVLGDTPAGRLSRIVEIAQYGVPIKPQVMTRLLSHPDVQLEDERSTSALEHAEWVVEKLLDGDYVAPDSFMDLVLTLDRVISAMLTAVRGKAPDDVVEGMRMWIEEAQLMLQEAQAAQMAAMAPEIPSEGNMANSGLPGVLDPTQADTSETMVPGLVPEMPLAQG